MKMRSPGRSETFIAGLGDDFRDPDDAVAILRAPEPDFLGLAHNPDPDRDEVGSELLGELVFRMRQVLEQNRPEPPAEMESLDRFARLRPVAFGGLEQGDGMLQRHALARSGGLRRLLQNFRVGKAIHGCLSTGLQKVN
jgi:hypothetical protein